MDAMSRVHPPAKSPCGSCPYRQDVPSGVWDEDEYAKLPLFDKETFDQPPSVFMCHQQDGRLCAGWVAVHDMVNNFGMRMALSLGRIDPSDADAIYDYSTTVPLFDSGVEAAKHGLASVEDPDEKARRIVRKLVKTKNVGQRHANANLAVACVRCGERYPRMFRFGDEIYCKTPDACRKVRAST